MWGGEGAEEGACLFRGVVGPGVGRVCVRAGAVVVVQATRQRRLHCNACYSQRTLTISSACPSAVTLRCSESATWFSSNTKSGRAEPGRP